MRLICNGGRHDNMPNCDFYAVLEDIELILEYVLRESEAAVYESYSSYGQDLIEFRSIEEVKHRYPLGLCNGKAPSVLLQLLPKGAGRLVVEKIKLNPEHCEGATFRYCASGWGMIQLYFGGVGPDGIVLSHTNHNSEKRALKWESTYINALGPASAWNWGKVESTSRRLNTFIRKAAVAKEGSHPVLPAAAVAKAGVR